MPYFSNRSSNASLRNALRIRGGFALTLSSGHCPGGRNGRFCWAILLKAGGGGDIKAEGTPLSKIAKEIIWFPVQDTKGETISWTARVQGKETLFALIHHHHKLPDPFLAS
jgi:hypothetical protein